MKKLRIYIASPYTNGDSTKNVRRQIDAGNVLMDMGHVPFVPLLAHFQPMVHPRSYQDWIDYDLAWIDRCDALVRIRPKVDGEELTSSGADIEEEHANKVGIPVYTVGSVEEIFNIDELHD